ncbi:MAG: hypothetical protein V9G04_09245 [Nocardioides sp.]|jgi:hypothetical protein
MGEDFATRYAAAVAAASTPCFWHREESPSAMLHRLAEGAQALGITEWDRYGEGGAARSTA